MSGSKPHAQDSIHLCSSLFGLRGLNSKPWVPIFGETNHPRLILFLQESESRPRCTITATLGHQDTRATKQHNASALRILSVEPQSSCRALSPLYSYLEAARLLWVSHGPAFQHCNFRFWWRIPCCSWSAEVQLTATQGKPRQTDRN